MQYDGTNADSVERLAKLPLLFSPGERWEYSLSDDVLGRLVEVVSGMSLEEFFRTRIFEPLGMKDTYFYLPQEKVSRLATVYTYYEGVGLRRFPEKPIVEDNFVYSASYPFDGPRKLFSGGAGLSSTITDYARFCQMLLNKGKLGGVRLLSRKSIELMSSDQLGHIDNERGFGLGFGVQTGKLPLTEVGSEGSYSWGGFYFTSFLIDPKEDLIVILMAQLHPTGGNTLDKQVQAMAYESLRD